MRAKSIKENIQDILKPKTEEELLDANKKIDFIMNKIRGEFERRYPENKIKDFHYFYDGTGINLTIEFENKIADMNFIEDILYKYPQYTNENSPQFYDDIFPYQPHDEDPEIPDIEQVETNIINVLFPLSIVSESIGGSGYAVYGGGGRGGFGNPSIPVGGRNFGRGFGFGSSQNLSGGPNLMYTYSVKPLNQYLQQKPTPQDDEQYIHTGNKIKGTILNTKKDIEGQIIYIEKDAEGNIKWYLVLDEKGIKRKVDPTTAYLVEPDPFVDPSMKPTDMTESFYPNIFKKDKKDEKNNKLNLFKPKSEEEIKDKLSNLSSDELNNKMFFAINDKNIKLLELLLKYGADINFKNKGGLTPLIYAVNFIQNKNIVEFLLKHGADTKIKTHNNKSALDIAKEKFIFASGSHWNDKINDIKNIVKLLKKYDTTNESFYPTFEYLYLKPKANNEIINDLSKMSQEEKNNLLISTIQNNNIENAKTLIEFGANVNTIVNGHTPLIWASLYGFTDLAKILIKAGADITKKNKYDETPLELSRRFNHKDTYELLRKYYNTKENINNVFYPQLKEESIHDIFKPKELGKIAKSLKKGDKIIEPYGHEEVIVKNFGEWENMEMYDYNHYWGEDGEGKDLLKFPNEKYLWVYLDDKRNVLGIGWLMPLCTLDSDVIQKLDESFYPQLKEGSVKNNMLELAKFVADNFYDLPEGVGIDELVDGNFSPDIYNFYLKNKEDIMNLAKELMGEYDEVNEPREDWTDDLVLMNESESLKSNYFWDNKKNLIEKLWIGKDEIVNVPLESDHVIHMPKGFRLGNSDPRHYDEGKNPINYGFARVNILKNYISVYTKTNPTDYKCVSDYLKRNKYFYTHIGWYVDTDKENYDFDNLKDLYYKFPNLINENFYPSLKHSLIIPINENIYDLLKPKSKEELKNAYKEKLKDLNSQYAILKDRALSRYYDPIDFPPEVKYKLQSLSNEKVRLKRLIDPEGESAKEEIRFKKQHDKEKQNKSKLTNIKKELIQKYPEIKIAQEIMSNWDYRSGLPSYLEKGHPYKIKAEKMLQKSSFKNISDVRKYVLSARDELKTLKIKQNVTGSLTF